MPALPPVPNVLKLILSGFSGNSPWANILHFNFTGGPPVIGDLATWINSVEAAWVAHISGIQNSQAHLTLIEAIDLTSASGAASSKIVNHAGTSTVAPLGNNSAIVIKKHISRRYRGGHPKTFLLTQDEGTLFDGDSFTNATVTNTASAYFAFTGACTVVAGSITVGNEVNVSYYQGFHTVTRPSGRVSNVPTLRVTPVVDLVLNVTVDPKVGSQRRRTSGG